MKELIFEHHNFFRRNVFYWLLPFVTYASLTQSLLILLVDGDRHGDGYVTIIVVNANKILVLPIRRVSVQVNTPLPRFFRE